MIDLICLALFCYASGWIVGQWNAAADRAEAKQAACTLPSVYDSEPDPFV